jgi:hypothetical protein
MKFTGAGTEEPSHTAVPSGPNNVPDTTHPRPHVPRTPEEAQY